MEKEELKQILTKASAIEKNQAIGIAKEFCDIDDKLVDLKETVTTLTNKVEEDIEVILEII